MALLGLLAYKALKHFGGSQSATPAGTGRPPSLPPGGTVTAGQPGGGLGDVLGGLLGGKSVPAGGKPGASLNELFPGGLGGLLGGAAAGSVLSSGLDKLIKEFQASGQGKVAQSWVGTGPNHEIAPGDLADALGSDTLTHSPGNRPAARRAARRPEPAIAGLGRSTDAQRPAADRGRSVANGLTGPARKNPARLEPHRGRGVDPSA